MDSSRRYILSVLMHERESRPARSGSISRMLWSGSRGWVVDIMTSYAAPLLPSTMTGRFLAPPLSKGTSAFHTSSGLGEPPLLLMERRTVTAVIAVAVARA